MRTFARDRSIVRSTSANPMSLFIIVTSLLILLLSSSPFFSSSLSSSRHHVVHAQTVANTSTPSVPVVLFAGAPFPAAAANISVVSSVFTPAVSSLSSSSSSSGAGHSAYLLTVTLRIHNDNANCCLQWNRGTASFAKSLIVRPKSAAHSVFAFSRAVTEAPWQVDVGGVNYTDLILTLQLSGCMDAPRYTANNDDASSLVFRIPPGVTNPPLTGAVTPTKPLAASSSTKTTLPLQHSSVSETREIIGTVAFCILFACVLIIFLVGDCGTGATELLWTIQGMLIAAGSPCARHSFFSFSKHTFWMLRVTADPRSVLAAAVHTGVIVLFVALSIVISHTAKTPQGRLLHPKLGCFFICVFVLGGIQTATSLAIGGFPDLDISKDVAGRGVGLVCLVVLLVGSLVFAWSQTGSMSLQSMRLQPVATTTTSSSFWIQTIWRPVTVAKRNSPIAGLYSNIAFLPRHLNYLGNFLPFFVSLFSNMFVAVMASIDPNNIGGCVATMSVCIAVHFLYTCYVATGNNVCRSPAWTNFLTMSHCARLLWFISALMHLDCTGAVKTTDIIATALAVIGLISALVAAVLGILVAKKESIYRSNKAMAKATAANTNSGGDGSFGGGDGSAPMMFGGGGGGGADADADARSDSSPLSAPTSPTSKSPKKKVRKNIPPCTAGTGERSSSPLYGGVQTTSFETFENSGNMLASATFGLDAKSKAVSYPSVAIREASMHHSRLRADDFGDDQHQRPRGVSMESRLSSGSGGHEGKSKRSPSNTFACVVVAPDPDPGYCHRCGMQCVPGPGGSKSLCPRCKTAVGSSSSLSHRHDWDFPGNSNSNSSSQHHQRGKTGGMESPTEMSGVVPNAVVTLPSWEAPEAGARAAGVVDIPAWQQKPPAGAGAAASATDDGDLDWL